MKQTHPWAIVRADMPTDIPIYLMHDSFDGEMYIRMTLSEEEALKYSVESTAQMVVDHINGVMPGYAKVVNLDELDDQK